MKPIADWQPFWRRLLPRQRASLHDQSEMTLGVVRRTEPSALSLQQWRKDESFEL